MSESFQIIFLIVASIAAWEVGRWVYKELRFRVLEREGRAVRGVTEEGRWSYEGPDAEKFKRRMRKE